MADLPANARRLLQDAHGYDLAILNGVVVRRNDMPTDAFPGRLVRRHQEARLRATMPAFA